MVCKISCILFWKTLEILCEINKKLEIAVKCLVWPFIMPCTFEHHIMCFRENNLIFHLQSRRQSYLLTRADNSVMSSNTEYLHLRFKCLTFVQVLYRNPGSVVSINVTRVSIGLLLYVVHIETKLCFIVHVSSTNSHFNNTNRFCVLTSWDNWSGFQNTFVCLPTKCKSYMSLLPRVRSHYLV